MRFVLPLLVPLLVACAGAEESPKLVVQLVIDNLSAPGLTRCWDRFSERGFRRMSREGLRYSQARYAHGITFTGAGFATIATGASPSIHGIVANSWIDPATGESIYCVDDEYPVFGTDKRRGPRWLQPETLSDVIVRETGGRAFAISHKDRSAIFLAGHTGKAFWNESEPGRFVTGKAYFDESPAWLEQFTGDRAIDRYHGSTWELHPKADRSLRDDRPYERDVYGLGRTFPHPIAGEGKEFHRAVTGTPYGERWMLEAIDALLQAENLGRDEAMDYLGVGMSCADYVSHTFGNESLEYDSFLLTLDEIVGDFLELLDRRVGHGRWILGLCADHGSPPIPEAAAENWTRDTPPPGRVNGSELIDLVNDAIRSELDIEAPLANGFSNPTLSFDSPLIAELDLDTQELYRVASDALRATDAIADVYMTDELFASELDDDSMEARFARSVFEGRSGPLVLVTEPCWFVYPDAWGSASMHGSPYEEDRHVPLLAMGFGVPHASSDVAVRPRDLTGSLALWAGLRPPAQWQGASLPASP